LQLRKSLLERAADPLVSWVVWWVSVGRDQSMEAAVVELALQGALQCPLKIGLHGYLHGY